MGLRFDFKLPDSVIGIPIKNPEMFRLSLKLMRLYRTRTRARLANLTLRYISRKSYDEEAYVATSGSDMVNFLRRDYGNRWKIYDEEALEMFDEPKKGCLEPEVLESADFKLWSNDITAHSEFNSEMKEILTNYLDKRLETKTNKRNSKPLAGAII